MGGWGCSSSDTTSTARPASPLYQSVHTSTHPPHPTPTGAAGALLFCLLQQWCDNFDSLTLCPRTPRTFHVTGAADALPAATTLDSLTLSIQFPPPQVPQTRCSSACCSSGATTSTACHLVGRASCAPWRCAACWHSPPPPSCTTWTRYSSASQVGVAHRSCVKPLRTVGCCEQCRWALCITVFVCALQVGTVHRSGRCAVRYM